MKYIALPVEVDAFVIQDVMNATGTVEALLEDGRVVPLDRGMLARFNPIAGDYYVVQSDGYVYVNPRDVFERKYAPAPSTDAPLEAIHEAESLDQNGPDDPNGEPVPEPEPEPTEPAPVPEPETPEHGVSA